MLNAFIIAALAAGSAASAPYADCVLADTHPGMTDRAMLLVEQACAAKHPDSFAASQESELQHHNQQQQARRDAVNAELARLAEAVAIAEAAEGKPQPAAAGSAAAAVAAAEAEAAAAAVEAEAAMQPKVDRKATGADPAAGKNGNR